MPGVFLSYRRSDSQDVAGRIFDRLAERFSRFAVFKDVDSIPLGVHFPAYLEQVLSNSDAILVLIGPTWLTARDETGHARLENPDDFVRMEVETGLRLKTPTIPVTVSNAAMPAPAALPESLKALAEQNGQAVRPDPDFHRDMDRLIHHLAPLVQGQSEASAFPLDSALLRKLLELTRGWYNEVVHTTAQLEAAPNKETAHTINYLYVNTRNFLPEILSIRKLLSRDSQALYLVDGIDQFVKLLTYIRDGDDSGSVLCRPAAIFRADPAPSALLVKDPRQLDLIQNALQMLSDEITRLLALAATRTSNR